MNNDPNDEILVGLLRAPASEQRPEPFPRLSGADWERLLTRAARHSLVPLLYYVFKQNPAITAPEPVLNQCRQIFLAESAQSLRRANELKTILTILRAARVPVLVLKGAYLAEKIYRHPALRPMEDLDLLVKPADLARLPGIMNAAGYVCQRKYWLEAEAALGIHLPPFQKAGGMPVEFHWTLQKPTAPFQLDHEQIWARSGTEEMAGVETGTMATEHLLLHLCLHDGHDHLFNYGLLHLYDLHEILRRRGDRLDWRELTGLARDWQAEKYLFLNLLLVREILQGKVPEEVLRTLQPPDFTAVIRRRAEKILFRPDERATYQAMFLGQVLGKGNWPQAAGRLWRKFFPTRASLSVLYSLPPDSPRILLGYPRRWRDVLRRYGATAQKLLTLDSGLLAAMHEGREAKALADWLARPPRHS